jgi:chemotaxis response regulator CheB
LSRLHTAEPDFPIVCVGGASADVEAYVGLLRHLRADLDVAVVIVNHLSPVDDLLLEALPGCTSMPVLLITDRMPVRPNCVYIGHQERDLHVLNGEFRLRPISKPTGWPNVITVFLESLTRNWAGKLIAVIYSGYDGDGTAALRGIKEVGGVTIARRVETAGQPDMPLTAIASGYIDYILTAEQIALEIERVALEVRAGRRAHKRQSAG